MPNVGTTQWRQCRLTWTILDWNGDPANVVDYMFTATASTVQLAGDVPTLAAMWPEVRWINGVMCDKDGNPGVYVPATMDPAINPTNFSMTVAASLADGRKITATLPTPVDGDLDLNNFLDLPTTPPV